MLIIVKIQTNIGLAFEHLFRILPKNHAGPVEKLISDIFRMPKKSWRNRFLIT